MDPDLHSTTGDAFRSGSGKVVTRVVSPGEIEIIFAAPGAGLAELFDTVAMLSAQSPQKEMTEPPSLYLPEPCASHILPVLVKRHLRRGSPTRRRRARRL